MLPALTVIMHTFACTLPPPLLQEIRSPTAADEVASVAQQPVPAAVPSAQVAAAAEPTPAAAAEPVPEQPAEVSASVSCWWQGSQLCRQDGV